MKIVYTLDSSKNAFDKAFLFGLKGLSILDDVISLDERDNVLGSVFLAIDKNMFNCDLELLENSIKVIDNYDISGILFYDMAVLSLANKYNIKTPLIWNQNFLVTNYDTINFYKEKGVLGAVLASEITISEIQEICRNCNVSLFVNIFGHQLMGVSKRKLVSNYFDFLGDKNNLDVNYMIERDSKYPIVENDVCTKIYSKEVLNGIKYLDKLKKAGIKHFILNGDLLSDDVFKKVCDIYERAFCSFSSSLEKEVLDIVPLASTIFFDRKTIYKVKKNG